jgi:hypothetical protein
LVGATTLALYFVSSPASALYVVVYHLLAYLLRSIPFFFLLLVVVCPSVCLLFSTNQVLEAGYKVPNSFRERSWQFGGGPLWFLPEKVSQY